MPVGKGGIQEYHDPSPDRETYTAGGTISGGDLVVFSANRTVIRSTAQSRKVAGVALYDALANEKVAVAKCGVWPLKAAGAIAAGDQLVGALAGAVAALADAAGATAADINAARSRIGNAQEAIADGATGRVELRIG